MPAAADIPYRKPAGIPANICLLAQHTRKQRKYHAKDQDHNDHTGHDSFFLLISEIKHLSLSSPCFCQFCHKAVIPLPTDLHQVPGFRILYSQVGFYHTRISSGKQVTCLCFSHKFHFFHPNDRIVILFSFLQNPRIAFSFLSYRIPGFHSLFVSVRTIPRQKSYAHPW